MKSSFSNKSSPAGLAQKCAVEDGHRPIEWAKASNHALAGDSTISQFQQGRFDGSGQRGRHQLLDPRPKLADARLLFGKVVQIEVQAEGPASMCATRRD